MAFAKNVLLIEPIKFHSNPQTAADNNFQIKSNENKNVQELAMIEFNGLERLLKEHGIGVEIIKITDEHQTPDALFPNNWFSTHANGTMVLYPMKAQNRRLERRPSIIEKLHTKYPNLIDLSRNEDRGLYLEGTGSIIIDTKNNRAYAALSERTSSNLLYEWSKKTNYETITFTAYDQNEKVIYHTNVLMTIGEGFCIICTLAIKDTDEKRLVRKSLTETGHEIIDISFDQLNKFCGNCLQLVNESGEKLLLMSSQAFEAFNEKQLMTIQKYSKIIHTPLYTIESHGGGGARCMVAELF
ncbi:MAG: amidinotransferase [Bacteroidetes bacterium]|nr:MAG: amidinotransferase [Bacteroidota bacterium]